MGGGCGGLARELSCWRSTFRRAAFRVASVRSAPRFARSLLTAGFSAFRKDLHPQRRRAEAGFVCIVSCGKRDGAGNEFFKNGKGFQKTVLLAGHRNKCVALLNCLSFHCLL